MKDLSHSKLRKEIKLMRSSIIRAKVHLGRKLIADIKKLSKKKVKDKIPNEKNVRKIQRLTDEVHALRQLKPDSIAEFALSNTEESAEMFRNSSDSSSRIRVLAKLTLNKTIQPIVEKFHESYSNWEEDLPKLLLKKTTETTENTNLVNAVNNSCMNLSSEEDNSQINLSTEDDNSKMNLSSEDDNDSVNEEDSSDDSKNEKDSFTKPITKKLVDANKFTTFTDTNFEHPNKSTTDDIDLNSKTPKKKVNITKKSTKVFSPSLKFSLQRKKLKVNVSKSHALNSSMNWKVENIAESDNLTKDTINEKSMEENKSGIVDNTRACNELKKLKAPDSSFEKSDKNILLKSDILNNSSVTLGLEINARENNKKVVVPNKNDSRAVGKYKVSGQEKELEKNDNSSVTNWSQQKLKPTRQENEENEKNISLPPCKKLKEFHEKSFSLTCKKETIRFSENNEQNKGFSFVNKEDKKSSVECAINKNYNNDEDLNLPLKTSNEYIEKISSEKNEKVLPVKEKVEDPFFLTKNNEKYLTLGKIVEEPKAEVPVLKTKEFKNSKTRWDDRSFVNLRNDKKFNKRVDRKFGGRNNRNTTVTETNIKLHPSWEARKKASTILPFQGKKICFDD